MNREQIIQMAKEAQMPFYWRSGEITYLDRLEHFAKLVEEHERETVEKMCRKEAERALFNWKNDLSQNQPFWNGAEQMAANLANAIQERRRIDE